MSTAAEIVREYLPHASDDEVEHVLWNHTGFPGFFNGDPETALRSQVCAFVTLGPGSSPEDVECCAPRRPRPQPTTAA